MIPLLPGLLVALIVAPAPYPSAAPAPGTAACARFTDDVIGAVDAFPAPCDEETAMEGDDEQDDEFSDHLDCGVAWRMPVLCSPAGCAGAFGSRGERPPSLALVRCCGRLTC